MGYDKIAVRDILDKARAGGRTALTAPEAKGICEAYGIAVPKEGVATSPLILSLCTCEIKEAGINSAVVSDPLVVADKNAELQRLAPFKNGEIIRNFKSGAIL